jgi:hypothetical protein
MTTQMIIEEIRDFLKDKLSNIELQSSTREIEFEPILTSPKVFDMYLPPKSYLNSINELVPENLIPALLVGIEKAKDNHQDGVLDIRITFITFSAGTYNENQELIDLNNEGYKDNINLMERTKQELIKATNINCKCTVNKPIEYGIYEEQPCPYWYGYMTFSVTLPEYEYNAYQSEDL